MDDHDQRFKTLLRECLPEFFDLFFQDWATRFDFTGAEFLEQEAFLDPPQGQKRSLDLVAKVPTREPVHDPAGRDADHWLVVVHIEVESADRAAEVRPRTLQYYEYLRRQHRLPVLPVCLFLKVGFDGLGWDVYEEQFLGRLLLRFEYAYIGLPALDTTKYMAGPNLLGVAPAALMRVPAEDRARLKAEGLERIAISRENDARKYLFAECFDNYLKLGEAERAELERFQAERFVEGKTMVNSIEERGRVRGLKQMLRKQLEKKFGPLKEDVIQRLESLPSEKVEELLTEILDGKSLKDLDLADV